MIPTGKATRAWLGVLPVLLLALFSSSCSTPMLSEPAVPRLTGAALGRACAAWRDEPSRLATRQSARPRSIFSGSDHACAALDDGQVACWGWNEDGQLVGGDREFVDTPAFLRGVADIAEVDERCARTGHGTVYCWDGGRLDAGGRRLISDYLPPLERARVRRVGTSCGPVRVPEIEDAVSLEVGHELACVLQTNGRVYCWGDNSRAQLARMSDGEEDESIPRAVPWLSDVRDIAVGDHHVCALLRGGSVACWGDNQQGQLAIDGPDYSGRPHPVPGVERAVEIDAAQDHTCARRRDGSVICWGKIGFIEGDERETPGVCEPTEVPGLEDVAQIDAGGFDCARRRNGRVDCWSELNCGFGTRSDRLGSGRPRRVQALDRVLEVSVGDEHACARRRGGRVMCWGEARSGGLGSHAPELATTTELTEVPALSQMIGNGRDAVCGLDRRRRLVCGKLASTPPHPGVERVRGFRETVVELAHAPLLDCARTRAGKVACWGGEGNVRPVTELGAVDHVYPLWSSAACAHGRDGTTACWGAEVTSLHTSASGQSPEGDEQDAEVETSGWRAEPIETPVEVVHMALDRESVCGLTPDDKVVCWPLATSEDPLTFKRLALGPDALVAKDADPTEEDATDPAPEPASESETDAPADADAQAAEATAPEPRPVLEVDLADVVELRAASRGFCARTETGEVRCWQVEPEIEGPIVPVPVLDLVGVLDWGLGALSSELCAVTGDGSVSCWTPAGDPSQDREPGIPATRLDVDGAKALIRLGPHPCVLREGDRLHCWGGPFRAPPLGQDEGLFVAQPVPIAGFGRGR